MQLGGYRIQVSLETPIQTKNDDLFISYGESTFVIEILPKDESRLTQVCQNLTKGVAENPHDYNAAYRNPVALKYLIDAIEANPMVFSVAVKGLGRIGSETAVRELIRYLKALKMEPTGPSRLESYCNRR